MKGNLIAILSLSFFAIKTSAQSSKLIPLFKVKGAYIDSVSNDLVIPSLHLQLDQMNKLYSNDSLLFAPTDEFNFCIYEISSKNYVLVSAMDTSLYHSPVIYMVGKRKVKIFQLENESKRWDIDLGGQLVLDIMKGQIILWDVKGRNRSFPLKKR